MPEIPSSIYTLSPENSSYIFRWTFRAGAFGVYKINISLKNVPGFEKSLTFEVKEPTSFRSKYALIFTCDAFSEANAWANNYEMYNVLVNHYNFSASNVFSLMDATCTKENLTALMNWLIENTDENATIVTWFTCHGALKKNFDNDREKIDGILHLWGSPFSEKNLLTDEEIARFITNLRSKKVLLGGDACNGGEFGGRFDIGEKINKIFNEPSIDREGVIIAVGAPWFRSNMVSTYGGAVFTLWFTAALLGMEDFRGKTADDFGNRDGKISVEEAFKWSFIQMLTDNPLYPYDFNDNYPGEMFLN
ncbi:MAG: caspase family protein [Thermoplasmata archaeon]|nr:caspase family protein [Thermoplasmata archaeon]